MMEKAQWAYQNVLKENRVENKFDHFLRYLLHILDRKYAKSVGTSISQNINLFVLKNRIFQSSWQFRSLTTEERFG
jgi:hypothetical protein